MHTSHSGDYDGMIPPATLTPVRITRPASLARCATRWVGVWAVVSGEESKTTQVLSTKYDIAPSLSHPANPRHIPPLLRKRAPGARRFPDLHGYNNKLSEQTAKGIHQDGPKQPPGPVSTLRHGSGADPFRRGEPPVSASNIQTRRRTSTACSMGAEAVCPCVIQYDYNLCMPSRPSTSKRRSHCPQVCIYPGQPYQSQRTN